MNDRDRNFITWLTTLPEKPNGRAALAELRRGLGQPPGLAPSVARYVQPFLANDDKPCTEEAYYLIAELFGLHPANVNEGDMGRHFTGLWNTDSPPENIVRRFNVLLAADWDTLPDYLRAAVSLLKSQNQPVNWARLLDDVLAWQLPNAPVQLRWSRSFWRKTSPAAASNSVEPVNG